MPGNTKPHKARKAKKKYARIRKVGTLTDARKELWRAILCARNDAVQHVIRGWLSEVRATLDIQIADEAAAARKGSAFVRAFFNLVPASLDMVDLRRWPGDVPFPPDDDLALAQREEKAMKQVARREKGKGEVHLMAASIVVMHVALCTTARVYSRDKR